MKRNILAGLSALALCFAGAAHGQEALSGTLKKIKETGAISLGHREASIPFSYYDDRQQVVGYSHEIMMNVVAAIKASLNMPNLSVRLMPVTSQNRIPLIQGGTIDIECGSTTNTVERQQQVAFSNHLFLYGIRTMVHKASGFAELPDLRGKNVVVTAGTTAERLVRKINEEKGLGLNLISAKDHGESFLTLETGRAQAFVMDEPLLYGELAKAKKPDELAVVGNSLQFENYACMLRKGDPEFKKLVDTTIAKLMSSGQAEAIYKKWFTSPIPPKGVNLNYPLSAEMKQLFKNPNDRI